MQHQKGFYKIEASTKILIDPGACVWVFSFLSPMKYILFACLTVLAVEAFGQIEATSGHIRHEQFEVRQDMLDKSMVNGIEFRSVGPTVMSGRVVDMAVNPVDATHFYVAYASGGLWESRNNGHSFKPLFDEEAVMTIGAIAVNWMDTTIWVGTGEVNSSRSSYSGVGVYLSKDKGKSWEITGLQDTQHIGKIIVHPSNPDIAWVASLGPLYSNEGMQGVFNTKNGGGSWNHVLDIGVGIVDLCIHPDDPDVLYASAWDRKREAWNFRGNGPGSGVYRSIDSGENWKSITGERSGFPQGEGVGRIGIDMTSSGGRPYVYAIHDNQARRPQSKEPETSRGLDKKIFKEMTDKEFMALKAEDVQSFIKKNNFPKEYSYDYIKTEISAGELKPSALFDYLSDANTDLFDTPVIGAEVYLLDESSGIWSKTHEGYLDDLVYSYGYYFGMIHVQPNDPDKIYIGGVPLLYSEDGGKNWKNINPDNVHADHHTLWLNPERPGHLINGNDGGINISYDNGEHYLNCNSPAVGQFYTVQVDNAEPYNIYGGLQDNGVWKGPSYYEASSSWHQNGKYPYEMLLGGDGMQIEVDPRDNETVYTGYQFGHYYRLKEGQEAHYFHPVHKLGERPLRWNWQTPIHLSKHNSDILYMGSYKVHRSMDKGETWEAISPDLTHGAKEGNVPFGTLASIDESPIQFGLLIAGSDDGRVHVSDNGGTDWKDVSQGLPEGLWVSRVITSSFEKNRIYVSLNGYRNDHMDSYIYGSDDLGKTWERLGTNLPMEPVNVILEDPVSEEIIYLGSDNGMYVSLDRGDSFQTMMNGLPHVPVHDMVIQERENDLVIGTHGRSIYVTDISKLRVINKAGEGPYLFALDSLDGQSRWGKAAWSKWFGVNEPETEIYFYETGQETCSIEIRSEKGVVLNLIEIDSGDGLQSVTYDLSIDETALPKYQKELKKKDASTPEAGANGKYYLNKGRYNTVLRCGKATKESTLNID